MILIDTGFFLALSDQRDQHFLRAVSWARACREPLIVSEHVLLETVNALSGQKHRDAAHDIVDSIRSNPQFEFVAASQELLDAGLAIHRQHRDKNWSLTDCISFHLMEQRGITRALAYDHHFIQAGFEALLRRDPG